MVPLKENGELDIEQINELPIMEYMEVMGDLTEEQFNEYLSKSPVDESIKECLFLDTIHNRLR